MLESNTHKITASIKETDLVLDIGGWAQPFNRANYVIDCMPYETRGRLGSQGGKREYFTKETWFQRDICSKEPFPFRDKEIDFVICSHTLEDVRDPIWVCQELVRIGKRGYLETPSRILENCRGVEFISYSGYRHHRWFVESIDNSVIFTAKFPLVDYSWRYHFPLRYYQALDEEEKHFFLFWESNFRFKETTFPFEPDSLPKNYEAFVYEHNGWPSYRYKLLNLRRFYRDSGIRKRLKPLLDFVEKPIRFFLKDTQFP